MALFGHFSVGFHYFFRHCFAFRSSTYTQVANSEKNWTQPASSRCQSHLKKVLHAHRAPHHQLNKKISKCKTVELGDQLPHPPHPSPLLGKEGGGQKNFIEKKFHPKKFHPKDFYPKNFHPKNFHPKKFFTLDSDFLLIQGWVGRDLFKGVGIKGHDVLVDSDFLLTQIISVLS